VKDPGDFGLKIGHCFNDPGVLRRALTHRSHGVPHNERLEFLGDSVLNCAIALELFRKFPELSEGDLSRLRASLVNQQSLSAVAQRFGFANQVLLGEGEIRSGGSGRPSILADAVEAVVGAAFLDGGFDAAVVVVHTLFSDVLATLDPDTVGKDPKYAVVTTRGEAHQHVFQVECVIPELDIRCTGEGASRRVAEQIAARLAYETAIRK
jgi:ribonuclease III